MKNFTNYEIIKITPAYFDSEINGKTYDFKLLSKAKGIDKLLFRGKMIGIDLSTSAELFNFIVKIEGISEPIEILSLSVNYLSYVC